MESTANIFTDQLFDSNVYINMKTAEERAELLSNVDYEVNLCLKRGSCYVGSIVIKFDLKYKSAVKLDFFGHSIANLQINDKMQESVNFSKHQINLPLKDLEIG
jgi:hypothetical protein